EQLARRLMAMRRQRGSLDFDLPEAEVVLGLRGRPEDIVRAERTMAHRIIEEFMLAANEAVATFLHQRQVPLLYRIHEPPELEKLQSFQEFVAYLNYGLVIGDTDDIAVQLQALLAQVVGKPEERMVNQVLLRSMKQARYAAENVGHFGLAAELYCHFTSPIRRYPDLVVHRILREVLSAEKLSDRRCSWWQRKLPPIAEHCSVNERRAMEAERDIVDLKKCQFMVDKVGEEFRGTVAGVQPFGIFVELQEVFVEGLVPIASLGDDYYQYEEHLHRLIGQRRRNIYQVGMEISVRLRHVDLDRRQIDFELV
ncbi:MAG: RNB domain-containing ribonuclease, partial [Syntrophotaleaceae bacterium]